MGANKTTDFEVMAEMIQRNLDISCSTHLVSANANPKGGVVTMGVDMATVTKLTLGRYRAIL
ncbi:hypothetical protein GCM10023189_45560 [Nibrella saemangeumensis]|uniref:Uncharacterized protein n=1 Tax=Nibrella saemangeumensis TaxID=1084526 RepID=A0ABP8NG32_9BACT